MAHKLRWLCGRVATYLEVLWLAPLSDAQDRLVSASPQDAAPLADRITLVISIIRGRLLVQ